MKTKRTLLIILAMLCSETTFAQQQVVNIIRDPTEVLNPLKCDGNPKFLRIDLEAVELDGWVKDGVVYKYWTYNRKVPGPMFRACVGDTIEVHHKNHPSSIVEHSVDFHAVTGTGGGAAYTATQPGEETSFTFKALKPGLFVYHCATPIIAHHISNGMYGLFLIEPKGGLPKVDHEFYIMQGEIYAENPVNGQAAFSYERLIDENPSYIVFNGAVGALTETYPLKAKTDEVIRIFFGVAGPNLTSSFHVIGEMFDRVYNLASLTSLPLTDVQTTLVPPGGAAVVELKLEVPGKFTLVDHALSRLEKGLVGHLLVEGPEKPKVFRKGH